MHFIFGLFFLLLIMALTFAYIAVAYIGLTFIKRWFIYNLYKEKRDKAKKIKPLFRDYISKRAFIIFVSIFIAYNLFVYLEQRSKWMGSDNANLTAKEYYVAGQVLYGSRRILSSLIAPDNLIMSPLNGMQQWVYNAGVKYLPECDGEMGIWLNNWFIYPFSKRDKRPKGTKTTRYSPAMMALIEKQWVAIEKVSTCPFADKQMEVHHYYRNFPGMALYYTLYEGFLTGKLAGSGMVMAQDKMFTERSKKLVGWLYAVREKWKESPTTQEFIRAHPKVEAMLQVALLLELGEVIRSQIWSKEFCCDDSYVKQYIAMRKEFIEGSNEMNPAYQRMREKAQAKSVHNMAISTVPARFMKYILKKYCKEVVPGKEKNRYARAKWVDAEKENEERIKSLYSDEIKILEEIYNGQ